VGAGVANPNPFAGSDYAYLNPSKPNGSIYFLEKYF